MAWPSVRQHCIPQGHCSPQQYSHNWFWTRQRNGQPLMTRLLEHMTDVNTKEYPNDLFRPSPIGSTSVSSTPISRPRSPPLSMNPAGLLLFRQCVPVVVLSVVGGGTGAGGEGGAAAGQAGRCR